jgi:hypothetical protein
VLTINGVAVVVSSYTVLDPERIGDWGRAVFGSLYSQLRATKRVWQAETDYLTVAEADAVKAAAGVDAVRTVTNSVDGVSMSAMVRVTEEVDWQASSAGLLRRLKIIMREA